jgi:hypothetical protein
MIHLLWSEGQSSDALPEDLKKRVVDFFLATPKALFFAVCSFFSGQLWVYIVFSYFKKSTKGNTYLNNKYGKTALGACWFVLFMIPIYLFKYKSWQVDADKILGVILEAVLIGAFFQLVFFIVITWRKS